MRRAVDTRANIYASCVVLADAGARFCAPREAGVLLFGPSGSGKSDLALRLIQDGALLVSDDRTDLFTLDGTLMAMAPPALAGLLEIRGLGILKFPFEKSARVAIAVMLEQGSAIGRMPDRERYRPPPGLDICAEVCPPLLHLDPHETSAPAKIVAAVAAYEGARVVSPGPLA